MSKGNEISRRDVLKLSGLALGTAVMAGCSAAGAAGVPVQGNTSPSPTPALSDQQDTLFDSLPPYYPGTSTASDARRIASRPSTSGGHRRQACRTQ